MREWVRLADAAMVLLADDTTVLQTSASVGDLLHLPPGGLMDRRFADVVAPSRLQHFAQVWNALDDGEAVECDLSLMRGKAEKPVRLRLTRIGNGETIVEIRKPHFQAAASRQLAAAMRAISDGLLVVDAQAHIVELMPPAERLIGWSRQEALGRPHDQVLTLMTADGEPLESPILWALSERSARHVTEDCVILARDGRKLIARLTIACVFGNDGVEGAMCAITDLTDQTLLSDELNYRASHDSLTGLLNREEFERRVKQAACEVQGSRARYVVCFIDLDQFKIINDTLGHAAGDELLRQVSAILRGQLRLTDVLARLGGDEYGVLLQHCDLQRARTVVDELLGSIRAFRFVWGEQTHSITCSIGVSVLAAGESAVSFTLSQVDSACFAAKDAGRDRARFAGDSDEVEQRYTEMDMVGRIASSLEQDRFMLMAEDVVSVSDPTRVVYRELLVRLRGEDGKLVPPSRFIPPAERYFLMSSIDRWVLRTTLDGLAAREDDGIIYALNVSGQSIGDEKFLEFAGAAIRSSGIDPRRLCMEITETAAVSRLTDAVHFIRELSNLGVRFALDDFGAGMASFSYLKNLPVDFLKIDGSFVRSVDESRVDRGMVEAINRIGHEMNLKVIAEHVEHEGVLEILKNIGVDYAQGWFIAPGAPF